MGFLDELLRGAQDTASRAYDQLNPNDGGKNWNQRTARPAPRQQPKKKVNYSPAVQARLDQMDRDVAKSKGDVYNPLHLLDAAGTVGKGIVDMGTGTITGIGNRVADFGEAGAEVIREFSGQNQAAANLKQKQAAEYERMSQSFAQRAMQEQDPARRAAFINQSRSLATTKSDLLDKNAQDIQRGLNATDPRKTLTNAAETALDVATAGKGKLLLDGIKSTAAPVTKEALKQLAKNTAVTATQGAGLGAGYGGINTARDADATLQDYARNIGTGAAMGAATGVVAQAALPALAKGAEKTAQGTAKVAGAAKKQLDIAARKQQENIYRMAAQDKILTRVEPHYIQPSNKPLDQGIVSQHRAAIINGDIDPIIVTKNADGTLKTLDGEHRLQAYKELGFPQIPTRIVTPGEVKMMKQGGYAKVPGEKYQKQWKPHELMYLEQSARKAGDVKQADAYKLQREQMQTSTANEADIANNYMAEMMQPQEKPVGQSKKQLSNAPNWQENSLTKGGKAGRQNLSPEVQAGLEGSHAVRNTKDLQATAVANADTMNTNDLIANAHESLAVPMGKIDDTTVANVQQAIERADLEGRTKDAIDLHDALSEHLTKQGQTIQAASLLYRLSPQGLFYKGMKDLKKAGANVTPELQDQLKSLADTIKTAPDQAAKQRATAAFNKLVADTMPQNTTKNIISVWKAGLLSGAKTQGGNFLSNGTFGALKAVSNVPSTAIDMGISAFTKQRTKTATLKGTLEGAGQGFKGAVDTMKTGIDARNINGDKYEIHGEINFKNPVIQKVFGTPSNLVFRSMSAADQPFYYAALRNNLNDLAKVEGINKGLKGKALADFTKNTVANPSMKLAETAKAAAEKAVLGQDNKIASAVTGITNKFPAAGVLVPFVKVPTNFIGRVLDYTPVGAVSQAVKQIRAKKFDQRALVEALGEATTGTAIIFLGAELANNNLLSGQYPSNDAKEAQRWKAEGITPNSVKIGDKWIGLNYLGPAGLLFGAGKDFHDAAAKGDSGTIASIAGLGKNLTGQSFLTGFSGFSNAIQDPQRSAGSFINSQAGSVIPSWINDMANLFDDKQRETNSPTDAIKSRTPGARNTLPVKQDVYGNDLKQRTGRVDQWLNPLKPSSSVTSPTLAEVNRLHTVDPNNKDLQVTPTQLDKAISFGGTGTDGKAVPAVKLTNEQRHDLQKQVGQATQQAWGQLIQSDKYKALNDTDKAAALNNVRSKVTEAEQARFAMANNMGQYAQDFTGKKKKLSKDANAVLTGQPDFTKFAKTAGASSTSESISPNLAKNYKQILDEFDSLSSDERDQKIYKENDAEFKYEAAKYENKKANGTLTKAEKIKAEDKLATLQIGSKFSKETRELYGLNKTQLTSLIDKGEITEKQAADILSLNDAMTVAGKTNKFRDKYGNVAIRPKAKGSGGGRKKGTGKGGKGKAGSKKQLPSDDSTSTINLVASLSRKAANAKIAKRSIPSGGGVRAPGIKAYKKVAKTNVSMTRKA
jgi:hypothetical protein